MSPPDAPPPPENRGREQKSACQHDVNTNNTAAENRDRLTDTASRLETAASVTARNALGDPIWIWDGKLARAFTRLLDRCRQDVELASGDDQ